MTEGFGRQLLISEPRRGGTQWRVKLDHNAIRNHLNRHIVGDHFLNELPASTAGWGDRPPIIGASDVSQHRSKIPIPARHFKRSVPFVLSNAAGALHTTVDGEKRFENLFNPRPNDELLRWMLVDPSYQDLLEPEDYQRCIASAMDVGQYKFDLDYLLNSERQRPDVILRDGTLFPQDAFLDNYIIDNKRGEFTREAIRNLLSCLLHCRQFGKIYCGVSKSVQLRVFSAAMDWFIAEHIDANWTFGSYTLNDGEAMSLLLASPSFVANNLDKLLCTCLIKRSFATRAELNSRARNPDDLSSHFAEFQDRHRLFDIADFRHLCDVGQLYMFFIGHSKSPHQRLPRYEFFYYDDMGPAWEVARAILKAVQLCSLATDHDHSFMAAEPVTYLLPSITRHAHELSKQVGQYIDSMTGQKIMARFLNRAGFSE